MVGALRKVMDEAHAGLSQELAEHYPAGCGVWSVTVGGQTLYATRREDAEIFAAKHDGTVVGPAGDGVKESDGGDQSSGEMVGGFPVPAAPSHAERTGAIHPTRQGAGVGRRDGSGVTAGETAPHSGGPSEPTPDVGAEPVAAFAAWHPTGGFMLSSVAECEEQAAEFTPPDVIEMGWQIVPVEIRRASASPASPPAVVPGRDEIVRAIIDCHPALAHHMRYENWIEQEKWDGDQGEFAREWMEARRLEADAIRSILVADCKAGWKLVPVDPTEEMLRAHHRALKEHIDSFSQDERDQRWRNKLKQGTSWVPRVPHDEKALVRYRAMIGATPQPDPAPTFRDGIGWLIEKDDPPVYHTVFDYDDHWTADANKALRFARREDAQAYSDHVGWTSPPIRIVEHMWPAPPVAAGSERDDG